MHQGRMLKVVDKLAGKKDRMTQRLEAAGKTRVGNQISCKQISGRPTGCQRQGEAGSSGKSSEM